MPNPNEPPGMQEFLNPKSMITPGIAGGIVMLIGQALSNSFPLPLAPTTIVLSFLVGLLVFVSSTIVIWQRFVFYIVNSLIIFSVAVGTSAAASRNAGTPKQASEIAEHLQQATQQLSGIETSENQLKLSLAAFNQPDAEKAKLHLTRLSSQAAAAKKSVEASHQVVDNLESDKTSRWFKSVF